MNRPIPAAAILLMIAIGGISCQQDPESGPSGPNVLLISIDTLRPDHLGCYGYHRKTSPHIDKLAAEGVLFENTISSTSWTVPAHAALFSSLADSVHGLTETDRKLPDRIVTLAERFATAGYKTAGVYSGPYLHPAFGLGQGFDLYRNCTSYAQVIDNRPAKKWAMDMGVMRNSHRDITNPSVYEAVKAWLEGNRDSRFFLFVHMWDVHFDFIPPPPYDTLFDPDYTGSITGENFFFNNEIRLNMPKRDLEHLVALYDGEIAWTDFHVGKIISDLEEAGILDDTVVAVTSDHGTEFFEHGQKGHRMTLFDEVIRIPLVIRYPAGLPSGVRVKEQTRIIDVGPTLLELAGLPPAAEVMGHSLTPLARNDPPGFDNTAISELFTVGKRVRTLRSREWKFFDFLATNNRRFIRLTEDPLERFPLSDLTRGLGRALEERYREIVKDLALRQAKEGGGADRAVIPPDVLEQLKSLGYIGD